MSSPIKFPRLADKGRPRNRRTSFIRANSQRPQFIRDRSRSSAGKLNRRGSNNSSGSNSGDFEQMQRKLALQEQKLSDLKKKYKRDMKSTGVDFGVFKKSRWTVLKRSVDEMVKIYPQCGFLLKDFRSEIDRTFDHFHQKIRTLNGTTSDHQKAYRERERELLSEISDIQHKLLQKEDKEFELKLTIKSLHQQIKILSRQVKEEKNRNKSILEMMSSIRTEDPIKVCVQLINENEKQKQKQKGLVQKIEILEKKQRRFFKKKGGGNNSNSFFSSSSNNNIDSNSNNSNNNSLRVDFPYGNKTQNSKSK